MQYKPMPCFDKRNPQNEQEKLISGLAKDLHDVMIVFINLNCITHDPSTIFTVLRDSSMAYCGETLYALTKMMAVKSQIPDFLKECQNIFNCYVQKVLEDLE